jgi:hypothetical protein
MRREPQTRKVEAVRYGTDGLRPRFPALCIYNGEVSCQSSSGGSLCGGYMGDEKGAGGRRFVSCGERRPAWVALPKRVIHFIEFLYPHILFQDSRSEEVEERDLDAVRVPHGSFAFRFYDIKEVLVEGDVLTSGHVNVSGIYYPGGRLMTVEDVMTEVRECKVLLDNMRINNWTHVVRTRVGTFQPFNDGDVILPKYRAEIVP